MPEQTNTTQKIKPATKGSNLTPSKRVKYFNSPFRQKKIKDSIEQLNTYTLNTKSRRPNLEEKLAVISLGLPIEKEFNSKKN